MEHTIETYGGKIIIDDSDHIKGTKIILIDKCHPFEDGNNQHITIVVEDAGMPGIDGPDVTFNVGEVVRMAIEDTELIFPFIQKGPLQK